MPLLKRRPATLTKPKTVPKKPARPAKPYAPLHVWQWSCWGYAGEVQAYTRSEARAEIKLFLHHRYLAALETFQCDEDGVLIGERIHRVPLSALIGRRGAWELNKRQRRTTASYGTASA